MQSNHNIIETPIYSDNLYLKKDMLFTKKRNSQNDSRYLNSTF